MDLGEKTNEDGRQEIVKQDEKPSNSYPPDSQVGLDPFLANVSVIPPPCEDAAASCDQQFMLLLIGIPGSGKSTLAKSLQKAKPYKFVRVNQDDLGNRNKCEAMTKQVIANGLCPVIDRCNFDRKQRKHFLDIAKNSGLDVDCVILKTPIEECLRRCQTRSNHPTLQPGQATSVVKRMAHQLRLPQQDLSSCDTSHPGMEKFRTMHYIRNTHSFHVVLEQLLHDS